VATGRSESIPTIAADTRGFTPLSCFSALFSCSLQAPGLA
jgi:hypothetical protein